MTAIVRRGSLATKTSWSQNHHRRAGESILAEGDSRSGLGIDAEHDDGAQEKAREP
jgi:hypothetical protein